MAMSFARARSPGALSFALNISPDGRSFWTATAPEAIDNAGHTPATGVVFKVDIASGANPGNGRVMQIRFRQPIRPGSCTGRVTVGVPHDQSKGHGPR